MSRVMESRLPIEVVEVGADELAVLHTHTRFVNEVGHAARRVDQIVGTARGARLRLDDLDAVRQAFLQDEDARQPRIWGGERDVELHAGVLELVYTAQGGRALFER